MDLVYEKTFLRTMISNFAKILAFGDPGYFGKMRSLTVRRGTSEFLETISLTLQGTMAYYYIFIYREAFPTSPTPEQQDNINKIWVAMGHPENVVLQ